MMERFESKHSFSFLFLFFPSKQIRCTLAFNPFLFLFLPFAYFLFSPNSLSKHNVREINPSLKNYLHKQGVAMSIGGSRLPTVIPAASVISRFSASIPLGNFQSNS